MDTEQFRHNVESYLEKDPRATMYADLSGGRVNITIGGAAGIVDEQAFDLLAAVLHHMALKTGEDEVDIALEIARRARTIGGELE